MSMDAATALPYLQRLWEVIDWPEKLTGFVREQIQLAATGEDSVFDALDRTLQSLDREAQTCAKCGASQVQSQHCLACELELRLAENAVDRAWAWVRAWRTCATRCKETYDAFLPRWMALGEIQATPEHRAADAEARRLLRRLDWARVRLMRAERRLFEAVDAWQRAKAGAP